MRKLSVLLAFFISLNFTYAHTSHKVDSTHFFELIEKRQLKLEEEDRRINERFDNLKERVDVVGTIYTVVITLIAGIALFFGLNNFKALKEHKKDLQQQFEDKKKELDSTHQSKLQELQNHFTEKLKLFSSELRALKIRAEIEMDMFLVRTKSELEFHKLNSSKSGADRIVHENIERIEYDENNIDICYSNSKLIESLSDQGLTHSSVLFSLGKRAVISLPLDYNKRETEVTKNDSNFFIKFIKPLQKGDSPIQSHLKVRISNEFGDTQNSWMVRQIDTPQKHTFDVVFRENRPCKSIKCYRIDAAEGKAELKLKPTVTAGTETTCFSYELPKSPVDRQYEIYWEF